MAHRPKQHNEGVACDITRQDGIDESAQQHTGYRIAPRATAPLLLRLWTGFLSS